MTQYLKTMMYRMCCVVGVLLLGCAPGATAAGLPNGAPNEIALKAPPSQVAQNAAQKQASNVLPIRILVASNPSIALTFAGAHETLYDNGQLLNSAPSALEWKLSRGSNGKIWVQTQNGPFDTGRSTMIFTTGASGYFYVWQKPYRGNAVVNVRGENLEVINSVDVEEYVRGVVPKEMPANWPIEALKAQAIIARTYAISRLNSKGDYDLCATEACQVYGGAGSETGNTDVAAAETRGLIVAYHNRPAETYFHADSGGFVASAMEIWGKNLPYLVAKPDPESRSPFSNWTLSPTSGAIQNMISRFMPRVGSYLSMQILERSESNRVSKLRVVGSKGNANLEGRDATAFLRGMGAKSTILSIASTSPLTFSIAGNGHGVGLSQWGALGLAGLGWRYDQILGYYYQGVSLANYAVQ